MMSGAPPEMVRKFVEDNELDESAARSLRALPPHQQAVAIRWDLSGFRNPSAKFMSMVNNLSISAPKMPMGIGMFGMPMMRPMGMPPLVPPPNFTPPVAHGPRPRGARISSG